MPYLPCAPVGPPEPYHILRPGTPLAAVGVQQQTVLHWDGGDTDTYFPQTFAVSAYGGAAEVDATATIWLLVAVKGTAHPVLVKERDQFGIDTVLGGTPQWAVLRRMEANHLWHCRQNDGSAVLPTGMQGDLLYLPADGNAWALLHGSKGAVLYFDPASGEPVWLHPHTGDLLRGNVDGAGNLFWERYGIDQGKQGDFLMNDRDHSGLPIWKTANVNNNVVSGGSGSSAPLVRDCGINGTPPANWFAPTYVPDPNWINAIPVQQSSDPRDWETWTLAQQNLGDDIWVLRQSFQVSAVPTTCTIAGTADNYLLELYVNGNKLHTGSNNGTPAFDSFSIDVPVGDLVVGTNVLAMEIQNWSQNASPNGTAVFYGISFT